MIISAKLSNSLLLGLLSVVSERHANSTWHVITPLFIAFPTEEEHVDREVILGRGESMYSLSAQEMAEMLGDERLGFDWTDVAVSTGFGQEKGSCVFLYIQCIDSGPVHVWTDDESIANKLLHEGFVLSNLESLPFPMREIENLKFG